MTAPPEPPFTRKDIARLIGAHPDTVRRNERLLGLDRIRIKGSKVLRYPAAATRRQLRTLGYET